MQTEEHVVIAEPGYASDSSDEYWADWKRALDIKRAQDPEAHKRYVMDAWIRKHPGATVADYQEYLCEKGTLDSMPTITLEQSEDQQITDSSDEEWYKWHEGVPANVPDKVESPHTARNRGSNIDGGRDQHGNAIGARGRGTPTRDRRQVQVVQPYLNNMDPESQRKRAEWLQSWKSMPPLTPEQLTMREQPVAPKSRADRMQAAVHNIIGAANEMHNDFKEIAGIMNEPGFTRNELPDKLHISVMSILMLITQHGGLMKIRHINDEELEKAQADAAKQQAANNTNN
ncbi:hypothetical protein F-M6_0207 [Faustovirus]|nr:hypothetical protein F-M6_0207 [Faustovirus]